MKYFVIFLVLIGSSGLIISEAYGAYIEFDNGKDKIFVNNEHIVDFQLNWGSTNDLTSGKITFDKSLNETLLIQIPKNIPRTTNLDFGHFSLFALQTDGSEPQIKETESECFYILEIPVNDSDYVEIFGGSVAAGRWEPVAIDNEECNNVYATTNQNGSVFPRHGFHMSEMSPLKQFKSGIPADEIQCRDGLVHLKKSDNSPACVTSETKLKLSERGWVAKNDSFHVISPENYKISCDSQTDPYQEFECFKESYSNCSIATVNPEIYTIEGDPIYTTLTITSDCKIQGVADMSTDRFWGSSEVIITTCSTITRDEYSWSADNCDAEQLPEMQFNFMMQLYPKILECEESGNAWNSEKLECMLDENEN